MILYILIGFFPGVFVGLTVGAVLCAAGRGDRAHDERIREEWG